MSQGTETSLNKISNPGFFWLLIAKSAILFFVSGIFLIPHFASAYLIESHEEKVEDRFIISPVNLEVRLAPGESTTQKMILVNRLGRETKFSLETEDFVGSSDPDKSAVFLGEEEAEKTSARKWITPDIESFSLKHGERILIDLKITLPENIEPGGYYAGVFARTSGELEKGKDQVKLVSRVGLLVFVTVPGNIEEKGKIDEFRADKKFYRTGPVEFTTIFSNEGNIHLRPKGQVTITNIFGSKVAEVPVKEWTVLPEARRKQTAEWAKRFLLGKYTATLDIDYGFAESKTESKALVFYAFPWHLALILLALTLSLFYLSRYILGKYEIRRKDEKEDDSEKDL